MNEATSGAALDRTEHALILGSRVNNTPVFNKAGERIGHVDDLSIEKASGKVIYAIMSFGGFLGIGEKFHPLPWPMLDYDPERGGYVVPLDKATLADAPYYDRYELADLGGSSHLSYGERIFTYYGAYGAVPYW
ncbi:PRC-barrel domain-containing protein [Sphingomonas sp. YR710]|uniref:PRC-barrel domain-containing protein n=1 Tax=Sphingomonas sp. YR710 TaxID=1882773 RepID=UPI000883C632|nr:PRC-barrel domain-containing protein [Sphingomonas sp. YR710]SDD06362.1 PRC-barrel domain-containing protein [Sphingomonas sp. YR710]